MRAKASSFATRTLIFLYLFLLNNIQHSFTFFLTLRQISSLPNFELPNDDLLLVPSISFALKTVYLLCSSVSGLNSKYDYVEGIIELRFTLFNLKDFSIMRSGVKLYLEAFCEKLSLNIDYESDVHSFLATCISNFFLTSISRFFNSQVLLDWLF